MAILYLLRGYPRPTLVNPSAGKCAVQSCLDSMPPEMLNTIHVLSSRLGYLENQGQSKEQR